MLEIGVSLQESQRKRCSLLYICQFLDGYVVTTARKGSCWLGFFSITVSFSLIQNNISFNIYNGLNEVCTKEILYWKFESILLVM